MHAEAPDHKGPGGVPSNALHTYLVIMCLCCACWRYLVSNRHCSWKKAWNDQMFAKSLTQNSLSWTELLIRMCQCLLSSCNNALTLEPGHSSLVCFGQQQMVGSGVVPCCADYISGRLFDKYILQSSRVNGKQNKSKKKKNQAEDVLQQR